MLLCVSYLSEVQSNISSNELRRDFEKLCQRMRSKWRLDNEPASSLSETINFRSKASWKPQEGQLI